MSTNWTLTAGEICRQGLQLLGAQPAGQPVQAEDMQDALSALNAVLKELPLYGYTWPTLSARTSLTWPVLILPSDFYGYLQVWANGRLLLQMNTSAYDDLTDLTVTGSTATHWYLLPDNTLYLYPVPTTDPLITVRYQRLISDADQASAVNLPQYMQNAMAYGVAYESILKYDVPEARAMRVERTWMQKRTLMLSNAVSGEVISFSVADDRLDWSPENWQAPTPIPDGWDAGQEP